MALKLAKKEKEYKYVPVSERDSENPTTFVFRPLSKEEKAKLEDQLIYLNQETGEMRVSNASFMLGVIKLALKKVENVDVGDGKLKEYDFTNTEVSDEFLEMLPDDIIQELANVILAVSKDPQNADVYLGNKK